MIYCSFCGKDQNECNKLVMGPSVYICNECTDICNDIMKYNLDTNNIFFNPIDFLLTPNQMCQFLNKNIIGQNYAKKVISVAVYNHYKRLKNSLCYRSKNFVHIGKSNILLIGPTGSGKTLIAQNIAEMLNVPFAMADATTLTEAGYVGEDVESLIQKLINNCDYDLDKAQQGIIYLDEIDKLSRKPDNTSGNRDVSGEGVQQSLLKLIEGTIASIPQYGFRKNTPQEFLQINTSNILFIFGGAFNGIEKIIMERLNKGSIGFNAKLKKSNKNKVNDILYKIESNDLIKYGLIPELIGRLPIITHLTDLNEFSLMQILNNPTDSLINQYIRLFELDGVELEFQEDAIIAIAQQAIKRKSGARGLRSIIEKYLLNTMYDIPNIQYICKVIITKDVILNNKQPIYVY
ncbi:ATP-dependent Clp protease ATP-binding subunit ClpX [Candidatus Johnevansia muelleri]|uniref:ATP-dependent Clp protease ATP-binding subunit ClpX n=1 Tax=Candidatus Johnevansia muelleri TaxID=1495769 RepID=A0A078KEG9_9GAMM|nr:ATP-dependent Clp protease ATP-binding subunit ClpX [Candidatus Evansia muelleri]